MEETAIKPVGLYGYESSAEDAELRALYQVSLCFESADDVARFARFVARCAEEMAREPDWDHEHFYTAGPMRGESVIITRLDPRNR
ncbi:MAG: hypothetical protein KDK53_21610 [Maritimibacter sp.]|nr:hypothetical protein [Maritimibacter sp.]